jgi:TRAP-type C4-dicarboxylate transport system permease small subunit
MAVTAAVGILCLTATTLISVMWRSAFGGEPFDSVGLGEVGTATIALLGAAHAQREQVHVRVTILVRLFPVRAAAATQVLWLAIAALMIGWVAFQTSTNALDSLQTGEARLGGEILIWPARMAIAVSFVVLLLELLLQLSDSLRVVISGRPQPVNDI